MSSPKARLERRPFNEQVLQSGQTLHTHAESIMRVITEEIAALRGHLEFTRVLTWGAFNKTWWRIVRRITLGDAARDDEQLTHDLNQLRARANLSYLVPKNRQQRQRFLAAIRGYLDRAEPGSLAGMAAHTSTTAKTVPEQQFPQWLFAFDSGSWATFRALSLLAVDQTTTATARAEAQASFPDMPLLRASVLESVRLWPTIPLILRDTTETTTWRNGELKTGTSMLIFTPFFHRDDQTIPEAHRFAPQLWMEDRDNTDWPLVPFSSGPGFCPGRDVVLLTASAVLAEMLRDHDFSPANGSTTAVEPLDLEHLPGSLSPFSSRFTVTRR